MNGYIFKYLLYRQFGGDLSRIIKGEKRWEIFHHNGVLFDKPYIPKKIPIKVKGENIILNETAEELAFLYSKYLDTEYVKNKTFNKNFFNDFKKTVKEVKLENLEDCDFTEIKKYIIKQKELKKELSKEEKDKIKEKKDKVLEPFKICNIDKIQTNVGNYMVEPISLFLGRGCNPHMGKVKKRVMPEDVILNLSKDSPIPKPRYLDENYNLVELKGHNWKEIIHDNTLVWLASYKDYISGKVKYVWTSNDSHFKAESDQEKFELARKLNERIGKINKINQDKLKSSDIKERQISTALYLIMELGIRVGTEKGDSDVVGCTTLLVKNIELKDDLHVKLDFIGKDSIPYTKEIKVEEIVYNNLKEFMSTKDKNTQIFDKITASDLNKYLNDLMEGLTAKVFRTYKASSLMQDELIKIMKKYEMIKMEESEMIDDLLNEYIKANLKVSIMCNHVKNVSKNFKDSIDKYDVKIKELKKKKKEYKEKKNNEKAEKINKKIKELKAKRELKMEMKTISLDTAKQNYIDPRISISFLKKFKIDIDKVFTKKLQERFKWAMEVDETFRF